MHINIHLFAINNTQVFHLVANSKFTNIHAKVSSSDIQFSKYLFHFTQVHRLHQPSVILLLKSHVNLNTLR